jgi:hypothetical protein
MDDLVRAEPEGFRSLPIMLRDANYPLRRREVFDRRDREKTDAPRPDDERGFVRTGGGFQRGMHRARERLDGDGGFVGEFVRDAVKL